jgi:hypothetical protein
MLLIAGMFLGCALFNVAMAIPLIKRMVPFRSAFGIRMKATLADEWVWHEVHRASGRDFLYLASAQLAAVFVPLAFIPPTSWTTQKLDRARAIYVGINIDVSLLGLAIVCAVCYVRANRLLRERIGSGVTLKPCRNTGA